MSRYISILDLYNTVKNNDVEMLNKAIFFLGIRIHTIRLFREFPAIIFAAKLGHVDQVQILLEDFLRYEVNVGKITGLFDCVVGENLLLELLEEVGELRKTGKNVDCLLRMLAKPLLSSEKVSKTAVEHFVIMNGLEFLDVNDNTRGDVLESILMASLDFGKSYAFEDERICENPRFVELIADEDPLEVAMVRRDTTAVRRILADGEVRFKKWTGLMDLLLQIGSSGLFMAFFDDKTLGDTLGVLGRPIRAIFDFLLNRITAVPDKQSSSMISTILNHRRFDVGREDWYRRYFNWILRGHVRSAACIKHLVKFDQERGNRFFNEVECGKGLTYLNDDISAEDLLEIVKIIENLPSKKPEVGSLWREKLLNFPLERKRPDLVKHLLKYGIKCTESAVLNEMNQGYNSKHQFNVQLLKNELSLSDSHYIACFRYAVNDELLAEYFLSAADPVSSIIVTENGVPGTVPDFFPVLEALVLETGRKFILMNPVRLRGYEIMHPFSHELESKRRQKLSLRKLCRLAIRKRVIERAMSLGLEYRNVEDELISLYVKCDLPRQMVEYLLYRDGRRPVYYQILSLCNLKRD